MENYEHTHSFGERSRVVRVTYLAWVDKAVHGVQAQRTEKDRLGGVSGHGEDDEEGSDDAELHVGCGA